MARAHAPSPSYGPGLQIAGMNTKIIFTRNSPVHTVLINETTGKELYRVETSRRFVRGVTRVYRCDPATPTALNPTSTSRLDVGEAREGRSSEQGSPLSEERPDDSDEENGNEDEGRVDGAGEEPLAEDAPLVKNEIARWYWKWFSSPRMVFEGRISTRAEYMPFKDKWRG